MPRQLASMEALDLEWHYRGAVRVAQAGDCEAALRRLDDADRAYRLLARTPEVRRAVAKQRRSARAAIVRRCRIAARG